MSRYIPYLFLLMFSLGITAQVRPKLRVIKPVKPKSKPAKTDLQIGLGLTKSVLFLARNTKEGNDALGYTGSLVYGGNKPFRLAVDYTEYRRINIEPTWFNIKARTLEVNGQAYYRSKGELGFFLLSGLSYNVFSGYFTGLEDYLNLTSLYHADQKVKTRWIGFNAGVGFDYKIKKIVLSGSMKMRLGRSEGYNEFNIQDVCYAIGIRYCLRMPSVYKLFKGTRNRYFLDAE